MSKKLARPSFNTLLEWAMVMRTHEHPVWKYNSKLAGMELADLAKVSRPRIVSGPGALSDLTPAKVSPFVLKPIHGAASRGVLPLEPEPWGGYRNLFTGASLSWDRAAGVAREANSSPMWMLEEAILRPDGPLAYDWKFWVIGGEPMLAWQCDHNLGNGRSRAVKWWTPAWTDAGDVAPHKVLHIDPDLPPPRNPEGLMDTARRVAEHVDGAFIRVDLYEREDGTPVFGEITPHPFGGDIPFAPEWDERLGRAWLETGRGV